MPLTINKRTDARRHLGTPMSEVATSARCGSHVPSRGPGRAGSAPRVREAARPQRYARPMNSTPSSAGLKTSEIQVVIYGYIGVAAGYLGDFTYQSLALFYPMFCEL